MVDIQITQGKSGKWTGGENDVRWNRASIVGVTFGAVGVDYREASGGGVKKAIGGEEVKCRDVPSPTKLW